MQVPFGFAEGKNYGSACPKRKARKRRTSSILVQFSLVFGLKMPFLGRFACANLLVAFA
jgi:hypothetical protein